MTEESRPDPQHVVDGVRIDLRRKGNGRPMLFLQGLEGWIRDESFSEPLAQDFDLLLPQHPGFGQSEFPAEFRSVGDIAQLYLTLLDELDLRDVVLVGTSFGGWVAAEMATRSTERIGALVLVNAFGIRNSTDPAARDIEDIYAMSQADVAERFYHDPEGYRRDVTKQPEHVLISIARSREAMCFLGWRPYMHNPSLKRWLRRIRRPTLILWGESDRVIQPAYGRGFAAEIPNARFETIARAGHYPHIEQPEQFVASLRRFLSVAESPVTASA